MEQGDIRKPIETWVKSVETAYARRLPGQIEFTSRFRFAEQTIAGRRDRLRAPDGSLRLAHRYAGFSASYQPVESRDSRDITTRQQTLSLTANAQMPGLPSIAGSWARNHANATAQASALATVTRNLSASYNVSNLALRAGYGDRSFEGQPGSPPGIAESHVTLGSSLNFQAAKAPVFLLYDFAQSRVNRTGRRANIGRTHTAGLGTSYAFSNRTSAGLNYGYQRTEERGARRFFTDDHNGSLALSHSLTRGVQLSGGGGVRSARIGERNETESFAGASISAQGMARPGWRMTASAGRSYNWLPGERVRTADNFQTNTAMRLANDLELRGNLAISLGRRPIAASDTAGPVGQVGVLAGAGISARPLRTVFLDAGTSRSTSGTSLSNTTSSTMAYNANIRLSPASRLQLGGGWGLSKGAVSRSTTLRANVSWNVLAALQASGSYNRSSQRILSPIRITPRPQESASGTLAIALSRNTSASLRYSVVEWGRPGHVRRMNVDVSRSFGR